ncbi:acyltransferase [Cytophaga hutchinsonii]|nr:acyltransferase [Cytophaga hutchinsonii]SFX14500.1 transferase hexapeptide (six repeat-containing protein) [Cytophaga hutchinsonii ATCC 33406]
MLTKLKGSIKKNKQVMNLFYRCRFFLFNNKVKNRGRGNKVVTNSASAKACTILFNGNNNTVILGESASLRGCLIIMSGDDHVLEIGAHTSIYKSNIAFEDHHCLISIGDYTTIQENGGISAVEPYSKIIIGKRCMFSVDVDIRNTDSHSIIKLDTGERINPGKNIFIDDKVWLGAYVQVLKGVSIGNNSIVGIRSLVTKDIPSHALAVGVPAKVIKTNVDWREERI